MRNGFDFNGFDAEDELFGQKLTLSKRISEISKCNNKIAKI